MICYDCAAVRNETSAVAVCAGCGAGLCLAHAVAEPRYLTRVAVINRIETVAAVARVIHCPVCAAALDAQARPVDHRSRARR